MGKWERAGGAFNVNRRTEKLSLFADYSGQMNHFVRLITGDRIVTQTLPLQTTYSIRRNQRDWVHTGQTGLEWNLTNRTTVSSLITLQNLQSNQLAFNTMQTIQQRLPSLQVNVRDDELNDTWIYTGNLNLRHKLKTKGEWSTDLDYIRYFNNNPHRYQFDYNYPQEGRQTSENLRNEKQTPIRLWVAKTDYSRPVGKRLKFETGAKATFANFTNDIQFERLNNTVWTADAALSQHIQMHENIWAGYVNLSGQFNAKSRFQAGLRYEHTETDLRTAEGKPLVYRNYGNWFPTVFFTRDLTTASSWQIAYSRRISRPGFGVLAPTFTFVDPTYYVVGNERLLPALSHNVQTTYRFRKNFLLTLDYTRFTNLITYNMRVIPDRNIQILTADNIQRANNLALTFSAPLTLRSWWQMQTNIQGVRQEAELTLEGITQRQEVVYGRITSTQTFRLPNRFTLEIAGFYQSRSLNGISIRRPFGVLNVGLQKQLAANRGTLRLTGEDLLWSNIMVYENNNPDAGFSLRSNGPGAHNRLVRLTYSRSFGNQKVSVNSKRATGSDDERRRVN